MKNKRRIGIFPGTFDPVHNGHVAFALAAMQRIHLESVVFMPEPLPRGKQHVSSLEHRLAMLNLVCHKNPHLHVLALPDAQFTVVQTLPKIKRALGKDVQMVMLVGSDVAKHMLAWPDIKKLLASVEIVVGVRQGEHISPDISATVIQTDHAEVAASYVRDGRQGDVLPEVAAYIATHNLYQV